MRILLIVIMVTGLTVSFALMTSNQKEVVDQVDQPSADNQAQQPAGTNNITESLEERGVVSPVIASRNTINLSGQGLVQVPEYVFDRTGTQALDVSNNNLDGSLQAEVRHLQELRILDLSDNKFTGVPAEVGQLQKLEVLNLSNNQLTGLPYELGNLANLQVLDLRGNQYSSQDLSIIKEGLPNNTVVRVD